MLFKKLGFHAYALLALALLLPLVCGCGGGGGGGTPSPLSIQNAQVIVPSNVREGKGGAITVSADVTSPYAISYVRATVASSTSSETKDLALGAGVNYSENFIVPDFPSVTPQTKTYTVTIAARDAEGNTSSTSSSFQVSSIESPEPRP